MNKTIEKEFFEAFKWGGVVNNCIEWMRYIYNLPPIKPGDSKGCESLQNKEAKDKFDNFYKEILPKDILEKTEAFNDKVIMNMDSPLMDEIEANLNECKTEVERERYLLSLLKPFGDIPSGCGIARIYHPKVEIKRLESEIVDFERDKAFWQKREEDELVEDVNGKSAGTSKEQIEACNSMIEERKEQIDWVLYVNRRFCELTGKFEDGARWMQKGTVEHCLSAFIRIMSVFADRLDALLLTYGIDLMKLQEISGLYLKSHRLITDIDVYVGSRDLAQKYIDDLSKLDGQQQPENNREIADEKSLSGKQEKKEILKRGRRSKLFKDYLQNDDGSKLQTLHDVMSGKGGKEVALVIKVAIQIGWITKPTYKAVADEFGDIGNRSNYNKYINGDKFTSDEIVGIKAKLQN
ncbi:hypothetical protein I6E77_06205 [Bacteroides thetaiotaomicron]|jgi:hypothetical protein|uniref:hypothetical protein n=1 Tax=Bacteroides TaxID=816 RepID=UPI001F3929D2|nr:MULTISPECIES: hypothetical protein [Bacteroides]DAN19258.1 MAG TPA: hypothetical protein [Caudoviricetes sp.]MCF2732869.1 hypothetical protein [Bacteroides thetaiotaomicron]MCM1735032.1 hypothetical protein [Bacteroides faecis]MCM1771113.1 hypothetical protein [Bacteroides faecis]MCM1776284.1 hypothetical protein [Bacteroides faecis]